MVYPRPPKSRKQPHCFTKKWSNSQFPLHAKRQQSTTRNQHGWNGIEGRSLTSTVEKNVLARRIFIPPPPPLEHSQRSHLSNAFSLSLSKMINDKTVAAKFWLQQFRSLECIQECTVMHSNSKALAPSILFIHCVQNYSFAKVKKKKNRWIYNIDKTATLTPPFPFAGVRVYVEQASSFLLLFHIFVPAFASFKYTHCFYALAQTPIQC